MAQIMYESPKKSGRRSGWIDEGDVKRRAVLEERGWRIVGRRQEPAQDAIVLTPLPEPETAELKLEETPLSGIDGLTAAQRAALIAAGFDSEDSLRAATDAELSAVPGVGMGTVRNLRKQLKGGAT